MLYWRSNSTSWNYWTLQAADSNHGWSVALYAGSTDIRFRLRTCALSGWPTTVVTQSFR